MLGSSRLLSAIRDLVGISGNVRPEGVVVVVEVWWCEGGGGGE